MTLGSLFDGSGGFPLAGVLNGITPLWSSEIEAYPLRVTAARFPGVKQLGDVTKINGAEIDPVDIITFGSPCQDLSVAGKQLGIHDGQRSNLFFEAVRIIKEMRNEDRANGRTGVDIRPRFAVWENVPGAFSSNKGADFKAVLEALAGVCEDGVSVPQPKKWGGAGCIVGEGWSIAWRVYDAQYWGVPQRRKRIYLIADFASERAGEILFEREGVCGDSAEGAEAREGTAADVEGGVGGGSLFEPMSLLEENWSEQAVKNALRANASKSGHCIVQDGVKCLDPWGCQSKRQHDISGAYPTLQAYNGGGRADGIVYALQGNGIDRSDTAGCNGCGWRVNEMYTLNTIDRPAIAFDCRNNVSNEEVSGTLQAKSTGGYSLNYQNPVCYRNGGYGDMVEGVGTLRANGGDAGPGSENIVVEKHE
jgi:DNA (cytosine-5)-methyltransferase 1